METSCVSFCEDFDQCLEAYSDMRCDAFDVNDMQQVIYLVHGSCPFFNYTAHPQMEPLPLYTSVDLLSIPKIQLSQDRNCLEKYRVHSWTVDEDERLRELVAEHGIRQWITIALYLNKQFKTERTNTQCSQRYNRVLNDRLNKGPWTVEEDQRLQDALYVCGKNRWYDIARHVGGRSDVYVRYRTRKLCPSYFK